MRSAVAQRIAVPTVAAALALLSACGGSGSSSTTIAAPSTAVATSAAVDSTTPGSTDNPALQLLLDGAAPLRRFSMGTDRLGVWICHVPVGVKDALYNPVDFRLAMDPAVIVAKLNQYVTPYFDTISDHRYKPAFEVGGEVSITVDQGDDDCVSHATAKAADHVTGVVVIADAEHAEDQHGGWGDPGNPCPSTVATDPCPARVTGRAVYIGASDFHPDWGEVPAVDLLEHEIGHSLGFPHSGKGDGYTSAIDLMSNSAAPRDVLEDRRDGPDTLGINRVAAGWIPSSDVTVATTGGTFRIQPSTASAGVRLLVLPLDETRFLTVELLEATGFNDHLPHSGIVVHEIDQTPTACSDRGGRPCLNEYRLQYPVSGTVPYTDLLQAGATWSGLGWSITHLVRTDSGWDVTVERTN